MVTYSNDPDRPILIKTVVGTALLFLVLAGAAGGYLVAKDRIGINFKNSLETSDNH